MQRMLAQILVRKSSSTRSTSLVTSLNSSKGREKRKKERILLFFQVISTQSYRIVRTAERSNAYTRQANVRAQMVGTQATGST